MLIYVKMTECRTAGEMLDNLKAMIDEKAGEGAAEMMHADVNFEIADIRPQADFVQGWEMSI